MATNREQLDQEILKWVLGCRREAEEGRRQKMALMECSWRDYFNDYDFSKKADWQTKVSIPLWAMGVDQLAGSVQNALQQAARLFSIEVLNPQDPMEVARANFVHDLMHLMLHDARFPRVIGDAAKVGAITNVMAFKARIEDKVSRHQAPEFVEKVIGTNSDGTPVIETQLTTRRVETISTRLDIPVLNPRHLYLDPRGRNLYRIHEASRDVAFLQDPVIQRTWRKEALKAALDEGTAPRTEEDEGERGDMEMGDPHNPMRKQTHISEFWGDLYSPRGRRIASDKWITILNDRHIAAVDDYPFWHGEDPFIVSNLISLPFTPYGKLLYQHVGPLGQLVTEFICMLSDAEKFATLGAFAIDTNQLDDIDQILAGLYPGILLTTQGPNPIQQLRFQGAGSGAHAMIPELRQLFENGMATAEFLTGAPSIRGRATATEVTQKSAATSTFMESLTAAMQYDGLEPLLNKCYWNVIQFLSDWSDPRLVALAQKHGLRPEDLGRDAVTRYAMLKGAFKFHVSALTAVLRRVEITERLLRLLEITGSRPEFMAMLGPEKLQVIFNKVMEVFQFEELIGQGNQLPGVVLPGSSAPNTAPQIPGTPFATPPAGGANLGDLLRARG